MLINTATLFLIGGMGMFFSFSGQILIPLLFSIAVFIVPALLAAHYFVTDQKRVPTHHENVRFSLGTTLMSLLVFTLVLLCFWGSILGMVDQTIHTIIQLIPIYDGLLTRQWFINTLGVTLVLHHVCYYFMQRPLFAFFSRFTFRAAHKNEVRRRGSH